MTLYYLALDPGIDTGVAYLGPAGEIIACFVGEPKPLPNSGTPRSVVIELPKVYPSRQSKGDPNDLIKVAVQVGEYRERFRAHGSIVNLFHPHTWKGTMPKDIHHARIYASLTPQEQDIVARAGQGVAPSKRHNMLDAIGLAKWAYQNQKYAAGAS